MIVLRKSVHDKRAGTIIIVLSHCGRAPCRVLIHRPDCSLRQPFCGFRLLFRLQTGEFCQTLLCDLRVRAAQDLLRLRRQVFRDLNMALHRARRDAHLFCGIPREWFLLARHFGAVDKVQDKATQMFGDLAKRAKKTPRRRQLAACIILFRFIAVAERRQ